jgi:Uncharacterized protein conserved in bacteria
MKYLEKFAEEQTVCFTGHRPNRLPQTTEKILEMESKLSNAIENAIWRGKINFVSGSMSGFDILAAERVLLLKKTYPQIRCVLISPFSVHFYSGRNWTAEWEKRSLTVAKYSDFGISLSEHYYKGIYYERDRFIVDMSSEVIAYYDGGAGGTKYTIDYAAKQGRPVFNIIELS